MVEFDPVEIITTPAPKLLPNFTMWGLAVATITLPNDGPEAILACGVVETKTKHNECNMFIHNRWRRIPAPRFDILSFRLKISECTATAMQILTENLQHLL